MCSGGGDGWAAKAAVAGQWRWRCRLGSGDGCEDEGFLPKPRVVIPVC